MASPYGGFSPGHKNRLMKELGDRQRRERQNLKQELIKDDVKKKRSARLHKKRKVTEGLAAEEKTIQKAERDRITQERIRGAAPLTSPVGGPVLQRTVKGRTTPRWKQLESQLIDPSPESQAWPYDPDPEKTSIRQVAWESRQKQKEPVEEAVNQGIFPVEPIRRIDGIARAGGTRGSRRYMVWAEPSREEVESIFGKQVVGEDPRVKAAERAAMRKRFGLD